MVSFELSENEIWPGCREIAIHGELDLAVKGELEAAVDRAVEKGQSVLVDLSACEFMDLSGLEVLLRGAQSLRARGCELLLAGVHDQVERLLSVLDYQRLVAAPSRPKIEVGNSQHGGAVAEAA